MKLLEKLRAKPNELLEIARWRQNPQHIRDFSILIHLPRGMYETLSLLSRRYHTSKSNVMRIAFYYFMSKLEGSIREEIDMNLLEKEVKKCLGIEK